MIRLSKFDIGYISVPQGALAFLAPCERPYPNVTDVSVFYRIDIVNLAGRFVALVYMSPPLETFEEWMRNRKREIAKLMEG